MGFKICSAEEEDDFPIVLREFNEDLENLKNSTQEQMHQYVGSKVKIIYIFTAKLIVFNNTMTEGSRKFLDATESVSATEGVKDLIESIMESMKPLLIEVYESYDPRTKSPQIANEMFEDYFTSLVPVFQDEIINIMVALEKTPENNYCWEQNKENIFKVIHSNFYLFLDEIANEMQKLTEQIKTIEDDFEVISKEVVETFSTCSENSEPENCLHNFVTDRKDQILEQINASFVQIINGFKNAIVKNNARVETFIKRTETEYDDIKKEMIACFIKPTTIEIDSTPHHLKQEL